jgi:hypothetical protein
MVLLLFFKIYDERAIEYERHRQTDGYKYRQVYRQIVRCTDKPTHVDTDRHADNNIDDRNANCSDTGRQIDVNTCGYLRI